MPIEAVREKAPIVENEKGSLTPTWAEFFRSVFYALFGWKRSFTATKSIDFGNIGAGAELTATVTVAGARQGDAVIVTPKTVVAGLGCEGAVTSNDTVTVRRFNFTVGAIDPAADDFRVVVLQQ